MRANVRVWIMLVGVVMAVAGCSRYDVIPNQLEKQVNKNVTFDEIERSPTSYQGQLIVLGGEVLSTKRLTDKTQIEVLQLPLSDDYIPITENREQSQGRFYAYDGGKEILDPATLPKGTPITLVGEVSGAMTGKLGEAEHRYPTVRIKDLTKWEKTEVQRWGYPYPYFGGYYWYGLRPFGFYY